MDLSLDELNLLHAMASNYKESIKARKPLYDCDTIGKGTEANIWWQASANKLEVETIRLIQKINIEMGRQIKLQRRFKLIENKEVKE